MYACMLAGMPILTGFLSRARVQSPGKKSYRGKTDRGTKKQLHCEEVSGCESLANDARPDPELRCRNDGQ